MSESVFPGAEHVAEVGWHQSMRVIWVIRSSTLRGFHVAKQVRGAKPFPGKLKGGCLDFVRHVALFHLSVGDTLKVLNNIVTDSLIVHLFACRSERLSGAFVQP